MNGFRTAPPSTTTHDAKLPEPLRQITMLIVENQEVIRRGLLAILSAVPDIAARTVAGAGTQPPGSFDVVLASTAALESVEEAWGTVRHLRPLLVAAPTARPEHLELAVNRPADGYVILAELTPDTLRSAVLKVVGGRIPIPDAMALYLLSRARGFDASLLGDMYHLSPREAEVLGLLVAGLDNKEIAARLHISIHGVKRHVSALLGRFHSPNRAHLVSYVLKSGMATPAQ